MVPLPTRWDERPPPTRSPARANGSPPPAAAARARGPSFTVSRSTSRASSRSPDGSSTRLSCAAPRSSVQSAVSAKASKPNPGRAPQPCRRAGAGDASARGWGSRSRPTAVGDAAVDPKTDAATAAARRDAAAAAGGPARGSAARAPGLAASGWVAGSSSRSAARGGGSAGAAVSGSGLRPSARSSASTTSSAPRNRRASASRGMSISAPIVFRPSRSSVRTVSGSRRSAETCSGAQSLLRASSPQMHGDHDAPAPRPPRPSAQSRRAP